MEIYSYVVARDYGFAPNPFYGACSLATCKPGIRKGAQVGDWIVGTGSAKYKRSGTLVYAMQVEEVLTFNQYWDSPKHQNKIPILTGSKKQTFGDNIYHKEKGKWEQANSHHSLCDGSENIYNIKNDTKADRILIGSKFVYFGGSGPKIPENLKKYKNENICCQRGYKVHFPEKLKSEFLQWIESLNQWGYVGKPHKWSL